MLRLYSAAVLTAALACSSSLAGENVYRIGIPKSFFRDVPKELVALAGQPFQELMKEQTGLDGEMVQEDDASAVAKKINEGALQFGVLQGHEFAWLQEKSPELKPLFCSVERPKEISAVLLVRANNTTDSRRDLKGRKLALAKTLKDHARLFLEKQKADGIGDVSTDNVETVHDGIHKVVAGDADFTVADFASWNYFQKISPGAAKNVRVLAKSDEFPPTVLVYKKGAIADDVLGKIHDGFLAAHKNSKAAKLMELIKIERYDDIPAGYDDALKSCCKEYPTPVSEK